MTHVARRSLTRRVRTSPWLSRTTTSALLVVGISGAWPTTPGFAQATAPPAQNEVFDVASVKPHTSVDQGVSMVARPGGRLVAVNVPVLMLIRTAYQLQNDQIVGLPDWTRSARFDVDARADDPGQPSLVTLRRLQALLAERFKLATHRETREIAVYEIVRADKDTALQTGFRPTECPAPELDLIRPQPCASISYGVGRLTFRGVPMTPFLEFLAPQLSRVVVDRTGLDGRYDIDLTWTPEAPAAAAAAAAAPPDPNAVSIFTAINEQLGLKLQSARAPVEVLVVDSIEHPSPD